jgi:hypothetical protein
MDASAPSELLSYDCSRGKTQDRLHGAIKLIKINGSFNVHFTTNFFVGMPI